jgi:hypothetical protein
MPDVTCEQIASFTTMQVAFASSASRLRRATDSFDVRSLLPAVRAPTLVVHARSDAVQPIEQAQSLTAGISGAELLVLETGITPRYRRIPHAKPPLDRCCRRSHRTRRAVVPGNRKRPPRGLIGLIPRSVRWLWIGTRQASRKAADPDIHLRSAALCGGCEFCSRPGARFNACRGSVGVPLHVLRMRTCEWR